MNKYLSRKFIVAILTIMLCVGAFIFSNNGTVMFLSMIVGGVVALSYIFAETIVDISETDMMEDCYEEHKTIGFCKEDENE